MQSENSEWAPILPMHQIELLSDTRLPCDGQEMKKRVDHHVANKIDTFKRAALSKQILDRNSFSYKQIFSKRIGQDAVDLLGHGTIETSQAGLYMGDADPEFHGCQRSRDGGIHVAHDQDEIRLLLNKNGLDALEDLSCLHRGRVRTNL